MFIISKLICFDMRFETSMLANLALFCYGTTKSMHVKCLYSFVSIETPIWHYL